MATIKTPWAILFCKFKHDPKSDPKADSDNMNLCEQLFTTAGIGSNNMINYFNDISHGNIDLSDSKVFGPFTIDKQRDEYEGKTLSREDYRQLWRSAIVAAATDPDPKHRVTGLADFPKTLVCMNTSIGIEYDYEFHHWIVCDNSKLIQSLIAQTMLYTYDLTASRAEESGTDYRDPWDIMSYPYCRMVSDVEFKATGPGLNACNMRKVGWLDESRVWKPATDKTEDVSKILRPLHRHDLDGFLAAEVGDYLFEFRIPEAWDAAIPNAAIFVHHFEDNHSYIMRGTKGQQELLGSHVFELGNPLIPEAGYTKVTVHNIDLMNQQATLDIHIQPAQKPPVYKWPFVIKNIMPGFINELIDTAITVGGHDDGHAYIIFKGKLISVPAGDPAIQIVKQIELSHKTRSIPELILQGSMLKGTQAAHETESGLQTNKPI